MTANTWFKVKGSNVKVTAYVTANTDSLQIRLVSLLIYRVSASMRMRIAYSGRICSVARRTSQNVRKQYFQTKQARKIPERLARYRSAVEMQCFRNCMLSSLLLTRSVIPRDLHLWLPRRTFQNAIFSNKKSRKC